MNKRLKAKAIPYTTFKERIRLIKEEAKTGGVVEYDENFIYSFK